MKLRLWILFAAAAAPIAAVASCMHEPSPSCEGDGCAAPDAGRRDAGLRDARPDAPPVPFDANVPIVDGGYADYLGPAFHGEWVRQPEVTECGIFHPKNVADVPPVRFSACSAPFAGCAEYSVENNTPGTRSIVFDGTFPILQTPKGPILRLKRFHMFPEATANVPSTRTGETLIQYLHGDVIFASASRFSDDARETIQPFCMEQVELAPAGFASAYGTIRPLDTFIAGTRDWETLDVATVFRIPKFSKLAPLDQNVNVMRSEANVVAEVGGPFGVFLDPAAGTGKPLGSASLRSFKPLPGGEFLAETNGTGLPLYRVSAAGVATLLYRPPAGTEVLGAQLDQTRNEIYWTEITDFQYDALTYDVRIFASALPSPGAPLTPRPVGGFTVVHEDARRTNTFPIVAVDDGVLAAVLGEHRVRVSDATGRWDVAFPAGTPYTAYQPLWVDKTDVYLELRDSRPNDRTHVEPSRILKVSYKVAGTFTAK